MSTKHDADRLFASSLAPFTPQVRAKLTEIRKLILSLAGQLEGVGLVLEALRWGQFSFLTLETGSGSTIRIDAVRGNPKNYAIYFNCNTTLVEDFKQLYPKHFKFEGNRAIIFDVAAPLPVDELRHCISLALTYHQRNQSKPDRRK